MLAYNWSFPAAIALGLSLGACSTAPPGAEFYDPYETQNRRIHAFNKDFDRNVVRPLSQVTGDGPPGPVSQGVVNFATNFETPGVIVNNLLQVDVLDAGHNAFRFAINSTLGVGGIFDPASSFGLERRDSDFGETLYAWGVPEGAYQELPFFGPSTERDTAGFVVDFALNPLAYVLPTEYLAAGYATDFGEDIIERGSLEDTFDSILYESADSYAQFRSVYLQNRRFELGAAAGSPSGLNENDVFDPYADLFPQ